MNLDKKIFVAGGLGMVGAAIIRRLSALGFRNIVTATREELGLTDQSSVNGFFASHKFEQVYLAAAKVGGIHANNTYPADFIYQNLMIQSNVIHAAYESGVGQLLFLGSSCIYPRLASQPMSEESLLTGPLELTNEPYAIAKIAGIKLCESYNRQFSTDFRCIMPTNLYGPGDNFFSDDSHVVPALIRRIHAARVAGEKSVVVWGTGRARREFLHVDDMASASVHVINMPAEEYQACTLPQRCHLNVGSGVDCSIQELAQTISQVVGFKGQIEFDTSRPDGAPRKLINSNRLRSTGWKPSLDLRAGLENTYAWYLANGISPQD